MKSTISFQNTCDTTMKLLGDYWTLKIINELRSGDEIRFCELQRQLDNVNPVTLTSRLKKLEQTDLISRTEEVVDKISVTYSLTPLGYEVLPVISALDAFSLKAQPLHTTD